MSRSYKKYAIWKVTDNDYKRFANKKVRHTEGISSPGEYKKNGFSWNICDTAYVDDWKKRAKPGKYRFKK